MFFFFRHLCMGTIEKFEDLEIWKMARDLNKKTYSFFEQEQFAKDYKLLNQMNGSCGSIMDNIAEGFDRGGRREFIQFLSISKASAAEYKSQLYRALDRKYITEKYFEESYNLAESISRKIKTFMNYLKNSEFNGSKFN